MNILPIDELNSPKLRSEPYEEYFGEMELTKHQKLQRIEFAKQFEEKIWAVLILANMMIETNSINRELLISSLNRDYLSIVAGFFLVDEYINSYINRISKEIINSTFDNSNPYFLSFDRAMYISECEANTSLNYSDFLEAIKSGKKHKTWIDIRDKKERKTHREVGGKTIKITETFAVGDSLMLFPKDTSLGASNKEIINCRCSVKYS